MVKGTTGTNPLVMLTSLYNSLSGAEQKVADAVLGDPSNAVYSSITDLAEKAGVGETTVIRFCRKLGYRGFQEFKLAVAQDIVNANENVYGEIEESDDIHTIAQKITMTNSNVLQDTISLLDERQLEKALVALMNGRRLHFFGVGSSGITASDAKYRFMRLGFHADYASDSHVIAMNCALVTREDVVVGISTSGSTKDLVDAIQIAKKNGAFIICLTSQARSPITAFADAILLAATKESPLQGGAFSSKLAQIHVLDIVSTIVSVRLREQTLKAIENTAKAVTDKMY